MGGGEVGDAVVVDDAHDLGVLDALNGLAKLVVVGQNDLDLLVGRLDLLEELRSGDAMLLEQGSALAGQLAQTAGNVLVGRVECSGELGIHDGGHDGVVVRVLVAEDQDLAHELSPLQKVHAGPYAGPVNTNMQSLPHTCIRKAQDARPIRIRRN